MIGLPVSYLLKMPRIKLTELTSYEFCHHLTVRATDINYAGHLGNEALLGMVHEARSQFTAQLGFDTMVVKPNQVGLIIADLVVNFKSEAFYQDSLEVNCQFDEVRERSVRLFYCIRRTGQVIALVETGLVAFDYQIHKVVQLPEDFLTALEKYRMGQSCEGLEKLL